MSSDLGGDAGAAISRDDLVGFFEEAARAGSGKTPLIGVETEWLPVDPSTGAAHPFEGPRGVESFFRAMLARGFEDPVGVSPPTHLRRGPLTLNVEPGGQAELSGAPHEDLHAVARELEEVRALAREAADEAGFAFLAHGIQPLSTAAEVRQVPKRRYGYMADHFARHGGPRFADMMRLTGSVQVNLDYTSEADAGRKLRAGLLLAPVAAALFANSPIASGRPTGRQSERTAIWLETDDARCGPVHAALDGAFSFERLVAELVEVPTIVVRAEDGGVAPAGGRPFRQLLEEGVAGRPVTRADWELHLSTIFTDARQKTFIECRSPDAPPPGASICVPAFFAGILYHPPALDAALELLAPLASGYREAMARAAQGGPRASAFGNARFADLALETLDLAAAGLAARGRDEEHFLDPIREVATTCITFADRALEAFHRGGVPALVAQARI